MPVFVLSPGETLGHLLFLPAVLGIAYVSHHFVVAGLIDSFVPVVGPFGCLENKLPGVLKVRKSDMQVDFHYFRPPRATWRLFFLDFGVCPSLLAVA
jgi:hypothetical protein